MIFHKMGSISEELITTILRPGHPTNGKQVVSILKRLYLMDQKLPLDVPRVRDVEADV